MDEFDIETELLEIATIHESFDTENPVTYILLLQRCNDRLNQQQKDFINDEIERLKKKQEKIAQKWLDKFTNPISREPLLAKIPNN
jgi:hypothetical protein